MGKKSKQEEKSKHVKKEICFLGIFHENLKVCVKTST